MSAKNRRAQKSQPPTAPEAPTPEAEADAAGEDSAPRDYAELAPPRTPLEALERVGLERAQCVFLLAYLRVRAALSPSRGTPDEALAALTEIRAQPWCWSALLATDYVRFTRACGLCGLPLAAIPAMQTAATEMTSALGAAPPDRAPPDAIPIEHLLDEARGESA